MKFGRQYGNYFGHDEAAAIFVAFDPDGMGGRILSWTPTHTGAVYQVLIDGEEWRRTADTSLRNVPTDARDHIEVFEHTVQTRDEDLSLIATSALDRVKLTWPESSASPARYELYRSLTSGVFTDPAIHECRAGAPDYIVRDGPHDDDTYYYRLIAYDKAGNPSTVDDANVTVSGAPEPPTGIALTHDDGTKETTITWTHSTSADKAGYNGYAGDPIELTAAPTDLGAVVQWVIDQTGITDHIEYLVRCYDGSGSEEANLSAMVAIDLAAGVRVQRPASPTILAGTAIAAGEVEMTVQYDRTGETGAATTIKIYSNDGAGGAMDWGTPVGSGNLAAGVVRQVIKVESSGLTGGLTYLMGARARTAGAVEDANTETVSVLTDATAPTAPVLTAEVV